MNRRRIDLDPDERRPCIIRGERTTPSSVSWNALCARRSGTIWSLLHIYEDLASTARLWKKNHPTPAKLNGFCRVRHETVRRTRDKTVSPSRSSSGFVFESVSDGTPRERLRRVGARYTGFSSVIKEDVVVVFFFLYFYTYVRIRSDDVRAAREKTRGEKINDLIT